MPFLKFGNGLAGFGRFWQTCFETPCGVATLGESYCGPLENYIGTGPAWEGVACPYTPAQVVFDSTDRGPGRWRGPLPYDWVLHVLDDHLRRGGRAITEGELQKAFPRWDVSLLQVSMESLESLGLWAVRVPGEWLPTGHLEHL